MPHTPQHAVHPAHLINDDTNTGRQWLAVSGGAITGDDIVTFNGINQNHAQVVRANADTTALAQNLLFVAMHGVAGAGAQIRLAEMITLTGVNTGGSAIGNPVYLSSAAGGWTLTRPASPANQIVVGRVLVVNAATGAILLAPAYAQNDPTAGDLLLDDDTAVALDIRQAGNPYLRFRTSNLTEAIYLEPNGAAGEVATTDHSGLRIGSDAVTTYVSTGDFSGHDLFVRTMQGGPSVVQANRGGRLDILVGDGGASATAAIAGGAGGRFDLRSGAGGASTNTGIAGAGGALNLFTGGGGTHSVAGAGGGGGAGGTLVVETGPGGANSFAGGTAASGRGGDMGINTGVGGATSGAGATGAGGRGGNLTSVLGVGGAQSVGAGVGGDGGTYSFTAGAGGANTFAGASAAGGAGGGYAFVSGAGGATSSTGAHAGGAGGDFIFTGGVGGAQNAGAANGGRGSNFTATLGAGGARQTAGAVAGNGGAGGAYSFTTGAGGAVTFATATGNGGAGGAYAIVTGAGGAYAGGTATGLGGDAGDHTVTTGVGGASNSTGGAAQTGGHGGDYTVLLGNGGAQTGAAGNDAGRGGNYSLTAGNGGASTFANGGAGGTLALVAGNAGAGGNAAGGTITITPGTATGTGVPGSVAITAARRLSGSAAAIAGARVLNARDSGGLFEVSLGAAYDIDLPDPTNLPGWEAEFVIGTSAANAVTITTLGGATFIGTIVNDVTSVLPATGSTLTFIANAALGDSIRVRRLSATRYAVWAVASTAGDITIA